MARGQEFPSDAEKDQEIAKLLRQFSRHSSDFDYFDWSNSFLAEAPQVKPRWGEFREKKELAPGYALLAVVLDDLKFIGDNCGGLVADLAAGLAQGLTRREIAARNGYHWSKLSRTPAKKLRQYLLERLYRPNI